MSEARVRNNDHATSMAGAEKVAKSAINQKDRLLTMYYAAGWVGLTDEEAATGTNLLASCYWKRCGELRADGLIETNGDVRKGTAGVIRNVSVITARGRSACRQMWT